MNERWNRICAYFGSAFGFAGALFLFLAMSASNVGGEAERDCIATGGKCIKYYVVMKHPYTNRFGLALICIGFFIQFIPAIMQFFEWFRKKITKSNPNH